MSRTTTAASAEVERAQQLVLAQDAARTALTLQAMAMARQAVSDFNGWYDTQRITSWAAGLARQMESLQRQVARGTDAYLSRFSSEVTGKRVRPVGAVDVTNLRVGVTHPGAYARTADVYRYQQSQFDKLARDLKRLPPNVPVQPPTIVDPVEAAVQRVEAVVDMDVQLAVREQSRAFMEQTRVAVGFRRVIHPERSAGGACGLCAVASSQLYKVEDLLPIHSRCKCTTLPVFDRKDVAAELNRVDLEQMYKDAGATTDSDSLKRTRYQVSEHGELGPVLHPFDQPLRRRSDKETSSKQAPAKSPAERREAAQNVLRSLEDALPRAREMAANDPKQWTKYRDQIERRVTDLRNELAA